MEVKSVKTRLTHEQKDTIIRMYVNGTPISHLAQQFKVSRPTIYNIVEKMDEDEHKKIDFYFEKNNENKAIMEPTTKTTFLGVTIDTEDGPSNPIIRKALDKSFKLLDIMEFIKVVKFKVNMTMFDYFWQVVVGTQCTLVGTLVLEWFGYDGDERKQRQNFKKMLKNNDISYRELTQKDKELEQFPTAQQELQLLPHEGARACSKFLIMEPDDLKMAIMQLKTKNGHIIRQYYIDLEKLLKLYVEYTLYFNHREASRKITDLEQMMAEMRLENQKREMQREQDLQFMRSLGISLEEVKDQNDTLIDKTNGLKKQNKDIQRKLGIAVVDRAPLPLDESKHERFVLIKRNDPDYMPYHTIRAQDPYTTRKLRTQRTLFPNMEVLLDLKANPNSKTLYNRIKETLKAKGAEFDGSNITLHDTIKEDELIMEMRTINDQKLSIE